MRRRHLFGLSVLATASACVPLPGQTHKVEKQENVIRAVAVYEWTGDLAKPSASRVVPVSVYIDRQFEDAGVYLARPIPLALENGNVFELEKAGVPQGTVELAFARHLQTPDQSQVDDGWFAYGPVKPKPVEVASAPAKKSGPLPVVVASGGTRPHFSNKPDADSAAAPASPTDRSTAAGAGTTVSAGPAPKTADPDQPTMRRRTDDDSDSAKDDPERPTLKKRTPAETKAAQKKRAEASVIAGGDLNDDPDRPNLHRGKPTTRLEDEDLPPLRGLPPGMHQLVAVSDPANRPEHDFTRPWDSPEERSSVLAHLRETAATLLLAFNGPARPAAVAAVVNHPKTARRAAQTPAPPVAPADPFDPKSETVSGYTLSYGGAATYVFTAQTSGPDPRFVMVVAQREPDGSLKTALSNVTDAAHMDRTPQLRLVDVVDPDASNRASLLFELRGQTTREFALYRVIGAEAEQTLVAGPPAE